MNTKTQAEFLIYPSADRQFYFVLRAANHEVVLTSETYTTKDSAKRGIEAVRVAARTMSNFKAMTSQSGQEYFVLRAANNEVIGKSQMYSSASARNAGIGACQRAAESACSGSA